MIDLIIPLYNEEENIDRLMGSICAQTKQKGVMVTVVNDHSTDNSVELLERWKNFVHFPMQILTPPEKLKWPGLVRQYGVDHTSCSHIMFCDGDDILMPQAIEELTFLAKTTQSDIITSKILCEKDNHEEITINLEDNSFTWFHGKLYKRAFLRQNELKIGSGYNEDAAFNLHCSLYTNSIYETDKVLYVWRNNKKSLTRRQEGFVKNNFYDVEMNYAKVYQDFYWKHNEQFCYDLHKLNRISLEGKYWYNAMRHLALFYQWINTFYKENCDSDMIDDSIDLISGFVETTQLKKVMKTDNLTDEYKNVFIEKNQGFTYITLNDFLYYVGVPCDLRADKVIKKFGGCLK